MEKKVTNRKSKKEETPQVITTGIEEPTVRKISMLITLQKRGNHHHISHWFFEDENYAKAEMQKDIEKFKQAYLHGTYDIIKEEEDEVIICINSILLQWTLTLDRVVEIEGKTYLKTPNRYNQTYTGIDEEN